MSAVMQDGGIHIPRRGRGRKSVAQNEQWEQDRSAFADRLMQIKSASGNKKQAVRSWCYDLEAHGLEKSDFDYAEGFINDLRKSGLLPVDFTVEDDTRTATGDEGWIDGTTPAEEAQSIIDGIELEAYQYCPESFWDTQPCYIEMVVEKADLRRNTFAKALRKYPIPCTNGKGWSDINSRARMALRFQTHEDAGRTPVLLYCGDHDPKGIQIADTIRKNLNDLLATWFENGDDINWDADSLIVDRFGLTFEFIERHGLTWIDNLITSSGKRLDDPKHDDHNKPYVQDYLKLYGVRKCEANALTPFPEVGNQLALDTIHKYIDQDAAQDYFQRMDEQQEAVRANIAELMFRGGLMDDE